MLMDDTLKAKLRISQASDTYSKATLVAPTGHGYIQLGAEVDRRLPFLPASRTKKALLRACKALCDRLRRQEGVTDVTLFTAALIPPGKGALLKQRPDVHIARFDIAILIETSTVAEAQSLRTGDAFGDLEACVRRAASYVHIVTARNARRIGPVDHTRKGIFLFNYFYADDLQQNLAVWEYTAGWFEQETGLDNSTLLEPLEGSPSQYTIINHCRWDGLRDILPSLAFKPSFRSYILGNFEANNTAAIPILYRLA
jgi:hypothetical protein